MLTNNILIGRAEKKWTQQHLADAVGVSRQTIVALEQNKYNPSLVLAFKIAAALEKEITDIFEYKED
ncbi:transcriptional regulator [Lysinibacillus sp. 2017]|uniref:helix-turn-helix transcriptional regulator n=1 Tax=unclassified Lysinibacillus TaxID=2636778 RepID=UPI000D528E5A|nr:MULTISPECIES: helix-turn-helix transcriptional regulator [unclassified Lysinibacillus]AWE07317.1 transcriptional regulator [Lysinibacillus sp. 2017]TGN32057.1 transcriptional regulator [Lysinibacillus sp. S2017]